MLPGLLFLFVASPSSRPSNIKANKGEIVERKSLSPEIWQLDERKEMDS